VREHNALARARESDEERREALPVPAAVVAPPEVVQIDEDDRVVLQTLALVDREEGDFVDTAPVTLPLPECG
jgi:hypothetical protein